MADNVKTDLPALIGDARATEAAAVAAVAVEAARPAQLTDHLFAFTRPNGTVEVVDTRDHDADWQTGPVRATGTATVRDVTSFADYFGKWHAANSEIFADADTLVVVGVVDSGAPLIPGWQAQQVSLTLQKSVAWKAWAAADGQLLTQTSFAELIEDRLLDITSPVAADVLELVQDFHVASTGRFQSRQPLAGGSTVFTYADEQQARGAGGKLEIPKQLALQLEPFVGAKPVELIARFRYRMRDGQLMLGIKLSRPEDVVRSAFGDICDQVATATGTPVWQGRPLR